MAFRVVAGIGRVKRRRGGLCLRGAHDRQQQFLLRAGAVGLRFDDDLVLGINRSTPGVTLDDTIGLNLVIPYGSRHDAGMNTIFLQRRWACMAHPHTVR